MSTNQKKSLSILRYILWLSIIAWTFVFTGYGNSEEHSEKKILNIQIDDEARALSAAILLLEARSGISITYEDPLYLYQDEMELNQLGYPLMKIIPLSFQYSSDDTLEEILESLFQASRKSGHPGIFRFKKRGGFYHVYPEKIRNEEGKWIPYHSLLDTPISLSVENIDGNVILQLVCDQIAEKTGIKVSIGTRQKFQKYRYYRVENQSARDVIIHLIRDRNESPLLSWRLFTGPEKSPPYTYGLNFHRVGFRGLKPLGGGKFKPREDEAGFTGYKEDPNFPNEPIPEHDRKIILPPRQVTREIKEPILIEENIGEISKKFYENLGNHLGTMIIHLTIDEDGRPSNIQIDLYLYKFIDYSFNEQKITDPKLITILTNLIKKWRYEPARKGEERVSVYWTEAIKFTLDGNFHRHIRKKKSVPLEEEVKGEQQ